MIKYIISLKLSLLILSSSGALGQSSFKILGYIDTAITSKYHSQELVIRLKKNEIKAVDYDYKVPVNERGQFNATINIDSSTAYVYFQIKDNRLSSSNGRYYNISEPTRSNPLEELYLFEKGDSIKMSIHKDNSIQFSGKRNEKLNYQFQVYNLFPLPKQISSRTTLLENRNELQKAIQLETEIIKLQKRQLHSLLKSYKTELNSEIYSQLNVDAISLLKQQIYNKLPNYYLRFPNQSDQDLVQSYFMTIDSLDFDENPINDNIKVKSAYYTAMILEKEVTQLILFQESHKTFKDFSFEELINNLNRKYSGLLHDNLILLSFENYAVRKTDDVKKQYEKVKEIISDKNIREQLAQLMEKYVTTAYPFVFYDVENRPYKLEDYRGKLIVMDFWFTGCVPCTMVAKAMHPIVEKYRHRKDIVFITVSTDPKERWLQSIASGQYTSNGMVNLHTNGKGFNDPMIAYYKFTGFPQQLIIGKKGELLTTSPPRPDQGELTVLAFDKLIENSLTK